MVKVIAFLFLLLLGYVVNWKFTLRKGKEIIKYFIIFIGLPLLVFYSILSQEKIEFELTTLVIAISLIFNVILSRIGNKFLNFRNGGALLLLNSFPNTGFLGLPLCWILFGNQGLYYGSLYVLVETLVHYTAGIIGALESERKDKSFLRGWALSIKDTLKFPIIWIFVLIFILIVLKVKLPPPLMNIFGCIGKITLVLSLFYLGLNLEKPENFKEFYRESLYVGTFRFLISPSVILTPLVFLKIAGFQVLAFQALMPPAISNTIIASYFGFNEKLCANVTTILTLVFLLIFLLIKIFFFQ